MKAHNKTLSDMDHSNNFSSEATQKSDSLENIGKTYSKPELNSYGLLRDITMAPTTNMPQESGVCGQAFCGQFL